MALLVICGNVDYDFVDVLPLLCHSQSSVIFRLIRLLATTMFIILILASPFLLEDLQREVYMKFLQLGEDVSDHYVCRLEKCLHGLHDPPIIFYGLPYARITALGLEKAPDAPFVSRRGYLRIRKPRSAT